MHCSNHNFPKRDLKFNIFYLNSYIRHQTNYFPMQGYISKLSWTISYFISLSTLVTTRGPAKLPIYSLENFLHEPNSIELV